MQYVGNAWYVASWIQDIKADKPTAVSVLGEPIVLWRSDGRLVAFEDRCAHRLAPLSLGRCEGSSLRCMYHGMLYGADGQAVEIPGQDVIPPRARVRSYPVIEEHSWVWVWMGDPAKADEALIPPAIGLDHPDWLLAHGYIDYQAEASLVSENLLDLSHVAYVHRGSFGAAPEFAQALPKGETLPRGMRYSRWTIGTTVPVGRRATNEPVDAYLTYDFLVPGVLLMWNGNFPAGTAESCGHAAPDYSRAIYGVAFSNQAVTPTADGRARYFFSVGPHREHGDEKRRDDDLAMAQKAFNEDKVMIEAQQKVINRTPNPVVMPTAHDRAITRFNLLVDKLIREELSGRGLIGTS